jgi:hypothetical protein
MDLGEAPKGSGAIPRTLNFLSAAMTVASRRHRLGMGTIALSALVLGDTLALASWYMAQDERLGVVHFPISSGWAAILLSGVMFVGTAICGACRHSNGTC